MTSIITKQNIISAAEAVRNIFGEHHTTSELNPEVGIVLGSGLQNFGEHIKDQVIIPYTEVPHIVKSTVKEHKGRFIIGEVANKQVICMQGRLHPYEGHSADEVAFPIYVMKELGIKALIVTNAAGGINKSFDVGDIMLIKDQINFTGMSPCIGIEDETVGPRFFDMTQTYSPKLQSLAKEAANQCNIVLQDGIYLGDLGPNFETPAEICAYRTLGAAAVGMSTVLEVIAAASQSLPVLGLSLISNPAAGVCSEPLQMDDVYKAALIAADKMEKLLTNIIERI